VAEEVRNLANRCSEAAKNTTDLIESSIVEVEKGVENANQMADVLNSINSSIEKVNDLINEISISSRDQANNVREINQSLAQVNDVVQKNSITSTETAAASKNLSIDALHLQEMMYHFNLK